MFKKVKKHLQNGTFLQTSFQYLRKKATYTPGFHDTGFHGDRHLIKVFDTIISDCSVFVETGSSIGTTLSYVAKKYPEKDCYSCEPDKEAFNEAKKNTKGLKNVFIFNETSDEFLERIEEQHSHIFSKKTLFWLDAHSNGFEWPLKNEIKFISSNFQNPKILIDDFKVPGKPNFGFDKYDGQECSFEYIKNSIKRDVCTLVYPNHNERTSDFHPLRGWGLLLFNQNDVGDLSEKDLDNATQIHEITLKD